MTSSIVLRHSVSGAPHFLTKHVRCGVINAGDGLHEHPTQALLDAFTIRRHKGTLEGLTVAIVGDIAHSRVARSNAHLLNKLGARVRFCGPSTLIPKGEFLNGSALEKLPKDKQIVLHCKSGGRSAEVLAVVKNAGFSDAVHVGGGVVAWVSQIEPDKPSY